MGSWVVFDEWLLRGISVVMRGLLVGIERPFTRQTILECLGVGP
jgi:hypothetical protein